MTERLDIGQQVVCIRPEYQGGTYNGNQLPIYQVIYTVRGFFRDPVDESPGMWLEEIVNPPIKCQPDGHLDEMGWSPEHFRPCKKTSIEDLKKLECPPHELVPKAGAKVS